MNETYKKLLIIFCLYLCISCQCQSQAGDSKYPIIGQPCPYFELNDVHYYTKKTVSLEDFKGKWLILDFWNTVCGPCIASFPKVNKLQNDFRSDVQFLMIAEDNPKYYGDSRAAYEGLRKYHKLELAVAFDTALFTKFKVYSVPHVIIVDENGIVRAITYHTDLTDANISALISGKNPVIRQKESSLDTQNKIFVDLDKPLLLNGNGGSDDNFMYRSVLSKWTNQVPQMVIGEPFKYFAEKGCFQGTGIILRWLYNLAYFGDSNWNVGDSLYEICSRFPILEIRNPKEFEPDFRSEKNIYNYSTIFPRNRFSKKFLCETIQRDLKTYFGYEVSIESRSMPYWSLTVLSDKAQETLKTKNNTQSITCEVNGGELLNVPVQSLIRVIAKYYPLDPPFIDETNIKGNIDVKLDAMLINFEGVRKTLNRSGLDLVKKTKLMTVLVIKDSTFN